MPTPSQVLEYVLTVTSTDNTKTTSFKRQPVHFLDAHIRGKCVAIWFEWPITLPHKLPAYVS